MKTLLTIDWDFFVPEKPSYDLGHQESNFFLHIWQSQMHLEEAMKTTGLEETFWECLVRHVDLKKTRGLFVSDSHVFAYSLMDNDCELIINIDAHHDCWKQNHPGQVHCQDWLRVALTRGVAARKRKAIWIRPRWVTKYWKDVPPRFKQLTVENKLDAIPSDAEISTIHICRSGCWTPPWLDRKFIAFVRGAYKHSRKLYPIDIQKEIGQGEYRTVLLPRYTREKWTQIKRNWNRMKIDLKLIESMQKEGKIPNNTVPTGVENGSKKEILDGAD